MREPGASIRRTAAFCLPGALFLALVSSGGAGASSRTPSDESQAYLHYSLGRLLEVSGATTDALVQFRRAQTLEPGNCEIAVAIARVLYALGSVEEAGEESGRAVAECPDAVEPRALHAELLLVQGDPEGAERVLREQSERPDAPREFAVMYAQSLLSLGRIEDGEEYLEERAKIDSLDVDVASMLGRARLLLGDPEGAVLELKRAARLDPEDRSVSGMLARLLITLNRPEEGIPLLEQMLERHRPLEPEYISLAAGYSMLGEPELAHAALDSATARFGETPAVLRARAATYFSEGDLQGALESYEGLIEEDPEAGMALNFVAYTLADEGRDLDRALDYALKAVELESDNPFYRDTLGWTRFRRGELRKAESELVLALELGGDNPIVLQHLGDVLSGLGRGDEAVDSWLRALKLLPGDEEILERLDAAGAAIPDELRRPEEAEPETGSGR